MTHAVHRVRFGPMRCIHLLTCGLLLVSQVAGLRGIAQDEATEDDKLRIICFGAHPDDAEYKSGGTAALWAQAGHHVKLVSVTNGDIGH